MNNAKRILALVLTLALAASLLAGCSKNTDNNQSSGTESSQTETSSENTGDSSSTETGTEVEAAVEYPAFNVGEVTANLGSSEGGDVSHDNYKGVAGKDYTDEAVYTFNDVITATNSMNWNPLSWETNSDSYVLDFLSRGFYNFELNSTLDGWAVTCELAADYPVDVTADYVGQYGINEGDTAKAFKIALNPNATWEDGTPINADTYIYSYQQLLDPAQLNRRADSLYAGTFQVVGAKEYFYAGRTSYTDTQGAYALEDLVKNEDGTYSTPNGNPVYIALNVPLAWCSGNTLKDYVEAYGDTYFDLTNWETLVGMMDENGVIPLTDENLELFKPVTTGNPAWGETDADLINYLAEGFTYPEANWDNVGILKTGDYELVMITVNPIESPNYYVPYNLSSSYLVYEPLYEELKTFTDGAFTTTYGTSAETTMSYGPYRLDYFELDKQITFTRNENWYGYSDGNHVGQYQTDIISCQVIDAHETQLLAFLSGELDSVGLQQEDMEKYASSEYIRYEPQSYTTKLTFNTDEAKLAERGTQVLGNLNFRKAFSLAIDRNTFAKSYTAAGSAGYGMLNYMYVYDPFTGAAYRNNEAAMAALCDVYGLTYGPDGDFDDVEEAYDAITGYNLDEAHELMQLAYDQCVANGTYDGTSMISIQLSVYQSDDIYVKMFNYLNDALKAACEGTDFEGKVELTMKVDADYYDTMYSGNTDMIFSTWGGAAYSPFTLLYECYCDAADGSGNQMEYGFDTSKVMVTMTINGAEFTKDLQTWALWMDGQPVEIKSNDGSMTLDAFGNYDADTRCALFAKVEYVYLSNFVNTPIYYRNVGLLMSQKGDYAVKEYVDLVGFGGLAFYTYNYTDEEWATVKGTLTY